MNTNYVVVKLQCEKVRMYEFFPNNIVWNAQTIRLLGKAYQGGSEFNESLRAVGQIRNKDVDSWYAEWTRLGNQIERLAEDARDKRHFRTAASAYLRASQYYFQARILLDDDPRIVDAHRKTVSCFTCAGSFFSPKLSQVSIPFEGMEMHGYYFPGINSEPGPAILFVVGADTTAEEAYFFGIREAQARGISCLLFDGPGQGSSLIFKNIYSRHDYEKPIATALDYLTSLKEVNGDRIGLIGHSLGGYYAARSAAYDQRVKACVVWGACFDVISDYFDFYPSVARTRCRWIVGAKDDDETRLKLRAFNLTDAADRIKIPLLILHGENDGVVSLSAARKLYQKARGPKELKIFTSKEGGSWHCQHDNPSGAQSYIYDWLEDTL